MSWILSVWQLIPTHPHTCSMVKKATTLRAVSTCFTSSMGASPLASRKVVKAMKMGMLLYSSRLGGPASSSLEAQLVNLRMLPCTLS